MTQSVLTWFNACLEVYTFVALFSGVRKSNITLFSAVRKNIYYVTTGLIKLLSIPSVLLICQVKDRR